MIMALNVHENGRVLSVTYAQHATENAVLVEALPEGDITDYRYVDGAFVHDPLPIATATQTPTPLERLDAQTVYTAMMTDTLIAPGVAESEGLNV